jgi:ABC-type transporter Mla subunit MlaD
MDIIKSINSFFTKKQTLFVGLFLVALALAILWLGVISKTEANRQRG